MTVNSCPNLTFLGLPRAKINIYWRANFKTSPFIGYLHQAQILILEILNVFIWLIRLRRIAFLDLEQKNPDFEIEHFEIGPEVGFKPWEKISDLYQPAFVEQMELL
jgi:hypothetical protein